MKCVNGNKLVIKSFNVIFCLIYNSLTLDFSFSHSTGTSQWLDPRLSQIQQKAVEDCGVDGNIFMQIF